MFCNCNVIVHIFYVQSLLLLLYLVALVFFCVNGNDEEEKKGDLVVRRPERCEGLFALLISYIKYYNILCTEKSYNNMWYRFILMMILPLDFTEMCHMYSHTKKCLNAIYNNNCLCTHVITITVKTGPHPLILHRI